MSKMPDDLRGLHHKLRSVRFSQRASFGPELLGRIRRGDQPAATKPKFRWHLMTAAAAVLTAGAALALAQFTPGGGTIIRVDRCCYDLDGGGQVDDGVLILAERDARVHRLRIYEDVDGSGDYGPADVVRLDRGKSPAINGMAGPGAITIEHCCIDFDGGGPGDDGLLVIGVPPDRILMAAIYETSKKAGADRWLLR